MERRCKFLDNLPAYNYNQSKGEKISGFFKLRQATDTRRLGSTLLKSMIAEARQLCSSDVKKYGRSHQQVY